MGERLKERAALCRSRGLTLINSDALDWRKGLEYCAQSPSFLGRKRNFYTWRSCRLESQITRWFPPPTRFPLRFLCCQSHRKIASLKAETVLLCAHRAFISHRWTAISVTSSPFILVTYVRGIVIDPAAYSLWIQFAVISLSWPKVMRFFVRKD